MSSARRTRSLLFALLVLTAFHRAVFAEMPQAKPAKARDRYDDDLPPFATARLGTLRLRPANSWYAYDLSPDGKLLLTGERETHTLRLWEVSTRREIRAVKLPYCYSFIAVKFSPDGRLFAAHTNNLYPVSAPPWEDHSLYVGETVTGKILHRFGTERTGYAQMAFLSDGKSLAAREGGWFANGEDRPLLIWDLKTGKQRQGPAKITHFVSTPVGRRIATASKDGLVRICDAATGKEIYQLKNHRPPGQLKGHRPPVPCLAFSPNGKWLASADGGSPSSGQIPLCLWEVATGKERHVLAGHAGAAVTALIFSPDGRWLASVDRSQSFQKDTLRVWDVTSGKQHLRLADDTLWKRPLVFLPDSKTVLQLHEDGQLHEWDLATGKEGRPWQGRKLGGGTLQITPDGKQLLVDGVPAWDVVGRRRIGTFSGHSAEVSSLTFSPDGRTLASLDDNKSLRLWDSRSGKPIALDEKEEVPVWRYRYSAAGRLAAVGKDLTVRLFDPATGRSTRSFEIGTPKTIRYWEDITGWAEGQLNLRDRPGQATVFSPDGRWLAVAREDRTIRVWDTAPGWEIKRFPFHSAGRPVFPAGRPLLIATDDDQVIRAWELPSGKEVFRLPVGKQGDLIAVSPGGNRLVASVQGATEVWDLNSGKRLSRLAEEGGDHGFSRDGSFLVALGNRRLLYWHAASGRLLKETRGKEYWFRSGRPVLSPDGKTFILASVDAKNSFYSLWESDTGREVCRIQGYLRESFQFAPDGRTVVTATDEIVFRETITGKPLGMKLGSHRGRVSVLAFSGDGRRLASGSTDGSILIWDWQAAVGLCPPVGASRLEDAWQDLRSEDAARAYRAIGVLAAAGDRAADFLGDRLRPFSEKDVGPLRQLVKRLDGNQFAIREKASRDLADRGADVVPLLHQTLSAGPPLEMVRRIQTLLSKPEMTRWSPETVRQVRAVDALERIQTEKARALLKSLATGTPAAPITREARAAWKRLERRLPAGADQ